MKKSLILFAVIAITIVTVTAFATDKKTDKKAAGTDSAAAPAADATDSTAQKKDSSVCPKCGRKTQKKFYFEATPGEKTYCCSSFCAEKLRRENDKSQKKSNAVNTNSTAAKNSDKKKTKTTQ